MSSPGKEGQLSIVEAKETSVESSETELSVDVRVLDEDIGEGPWSSYRYHSGV